VLLFIFIRKYTLKGKGAIVKNVLAQIFLYNFTKLS
jgi:hypothetical protein